MRRWLVCVGSSLLMAGSALQALAQDPAQQPSASPTQITMPPAEPDPPTHGILGEPRWLKSAILDVIHHSSRVPEQKDGFYPGLGVDIPSAGWISAGPGFRHHLGDEALLFDASAAVSWKEFTTAQARTTAAVFDGRLNLGVHALWQDCTQVNYFGPAASSSLGKRSEFGLRAGDYTVSAATAVHGGWSAEFRTGLLDGLQVLAPSGWHDPGFPDARTLFTDRTTPGLDRQPSFWHTDLVVTADTLNHQDHPSRGWALQAAASAYRDRDFGEFSFERYELNAIEIIPIMRALWLLAVRESAVMTTPLAGNQVPFYLEPSLGGQNALRGYLDNRFQDRDVAALNVESRWLVFAHLDAAIFLDAGQAAGAVREFSTAGTKTSYGFGLRLHTGADTLVRVDLARGSEGWRVSAGLSDPLLFSTFKHWAAVVPITP